VNFPDVRPLSDTAKNILQKRYFQEGEKTWKQLVDRVVDNILDEATQEDKETTRQMMVNRYFIPNSPCLVNAGKKNAGLFACFVVDFNDTIEEIYKTKLEFALIARKGGGCGTSLSKIRPENSKVAGSSHGFAGGPLKFADTISHDMEALTQAGFRSMAIMFVQSIYHPDIIKFINSKKEEGSISNANMSVMVDDVFMNKVKNNEKYWTEFNGVKYQEYNAKDIFNLIIEGEWCNGEPSILFFDRINDSPYKYTGQEIFSTNPSLRKGTKILTDSGIFCIEELEGKFFNVINLNGILSPASCFLSGKNRNLWKISFSGSEDIYCTEEHKWAVLDDFGNYSKFLTSDLAIGDRIPINLMEKTYGGLGNYSDGFIIGWIYGDGWITKRTDNGKQQVGIIISKKDADNGVKDVLQNKLSEIGVETSFPERKNRQSVWYEFNTVNEKLNKFLDSFGVKEKTRGLPSKIWNECSKEFTLGFLDGLISSDGYVDKYRIKITTAHNILANEITEILGFMGISANNNKTEFFGNFSKDKLSERFDICFSSRFAETWKFTNKYKNDKLEKFSKKRDYYFRVVENIEKTNLFEDVWDIRVNDTTHCFSLANVITGNCSEQPLPPDGTCNLASLDLSKFLNKKNEIDYEKLELASRLGVKFLDTVIDKNSFPTKEIEEWSYKNRPIGLGIMGFADLCLMKEIAYGSEESCDLLESILSFIYGIAEDESIKLGLQKGVPEMCKLLPIPRRNITLNTVAPTGTVSLIAGCSNSVEPIFSEITIRNDKTGTYIFKNDLENESYFRCAVSANGAKEVTWEEHILILASAQKYIDSGVSKTINFPNHTHRETIAKAVMMAWEMGAKGIASYRNGSRKQEVLTPKNIKKDKCPNCGNDLVMIDNHKKCINCSWILKEE